MRARTWVFGAFAGAWALFAGCTNTSDVAGRADHEGGLPAFGDDASVTREAGLTTYCPTNECSAPYTTCPASEFACDVNLLNDPANCGSCGFKCPDSVNYGGKFQCANGKCILNCNASQPGQADCDGIADNGCEQRLDSNDHCGACGKTCPDPDKPCINDTAAHSIQCGCSNGATYCRSSNKCVDLQNNDANCGKCGTACAPSGEGGPRPPHSHYGCTEAECGHLKCDDGFDDCDKDLDVPGGNGCESSLTGESNCGACKVTCDPGQKCAPDVNNNNVLTCLCGPGKMDCTGGPNPYCVDILTDPSNCGGCGTWCGLYYTPGGFALSHYVPSCVAGSCAFGCAAGWADCNGKLEDGCETNIGADPSNCGACGTTCDAIAGQACVAGRCALAPCETDGGVAR